MSPRCHPSSRDDRPDIATQIVLADRHHRWGTAGILTALESSRNYLPELTESERLDAIVTPALRDAAAAGDEARFDALNGCFPVIVADLRRDLDARQLRDELNERAQANDALGQLAAGELNRQRPNFDRACEMVGDSRADPVTRRQVLIAIDTARPKARPPHNATSQMPAKYQLWYGMSYMALGAMSEAIANHLSGRRSLSESAEMWQTNPMGMTYTAFERAGLGGWIGRGMAYGDALGFGPGTLLGNTTGSTAAWRINPDNAFMDILGPLTGDASNVLGITSDVLRGDVDANTAANLWKLAPLQNLLWFRMAHQATGLPITPQSIRPAR